MTWFEWALLGLVVASFAIATWAWREIEQKDSEAHRRERQPWPERYAPEPVATLLVESNAGRETLLDLPQVIEVLSPAPAGQKAIGATAAKSSTAA